METNQLIESKQATLIWNKLEEISKQLVIEEDHSLLTGNAGKAIFFAGLYKETNSKEDLERCLQFLEESLEIISDKDTIPTFCAGFVGVMWTLVFLDEQGIVEVDIDEMCEEMDEHIIKSSRNALKVNYYDYMHGGLGAGIYFLQRLKTTKDKSKIQGFLSEQVRIIETTAIREGEYVKWSKDFPISKENTENKKYDLGLSHGIPSILYFLAKCLDNKIEVEICQELIDGAVAYVLNNELKNQKSLYPSSVKAGQEPIPSRNAWCYGDLGVCIVLLEVSRVIGSKDLREYVIKSAKWVAKKTDLSTCNIVDAGICHGSSGLALMFNRLYKETNEIEFKNTADYWFEVTLDFAQHKDGIAGYKFFYTTDGWKNNTSLLTGVTGVAISLLTSMGDYNIDWDRSLLLS